MSLEGPWYNELGSTMQIYPLAGNGSVSGTYETAVSSGCAQGAFNLAGRTDVGQGGQTVGFSVCWLNQGSRCNSVTSWSGQYQTINGEEQITALWLLTQATPPASDWASTLVGQDIFTRQPPTADEVVARSKIRGRSHP
jgi:hypothetical protein